MQMEPVAAVPSAKVPMTSKGVEVSETSFLPYYIHMESEIEPKLNEAHT
jgi:hypothetical protein